MGGEEVREREKAKRVFTLVDFRAFLEVLV